MFHPLGFDTPVAVPPAGRNRQPRRRYILLALLVGAVSRAGADEIQSAATKDFGLVGGPEVLWVYQYRVEGEHQLRRLRFAYRLAEQGKSHRFFRPREIDAVAGEAVVAAVLGKRLHLIYADGTHRCYHAGGAEVERKLPRNCVPLAMAGDDGGGAIYALVPAEVAAELSLATAEAESEPQVAAKIEDDLSGATADGGVTIRDVGEPVTSAPAAPRTPFAIVRFERGAWHWDRDAPEPLEERRPCWLAAGDGRLHLLIAPDPDGGDLLYCRSDEQGWTAPTVVPGLGEDQLLAVGVCRGELRLAAVLGTDDVSAAYLLHAVDEGFERGAGLEGSAGVVGAALLGRRLALAFFDGQNELRIGVWPLEGGPADAVPQPVDVLVPRARSWVTSRLTVIAYAALTVILISVFLRRRESLAVPAGLQPGQVLAPYSRRLLAFMFDGLIFVPVLLAVMGPAVAAAADAQALETSADRTALAPKMTPELLVRWLITASLFAIYGSIFEALLGATPGKRIVHCRVVDEHGQPCRRSAILLRNFARLVELFPDFQLMPAVVLIIVTRNRQRLGDLIARTVVVEIVPPPAGEDRPGSPNQPGS